MKTYLIIGAGPGIGIATAARFAKEGFRVVLAARSASKVAENVESLKRAGTDVEFATVDAADPEAVAGLVRRYGSELAVLHYNAGVLHYDSEGHLSPRTLEQETVQTLGSDMQVNLVSALAATQAAVEVMGSRGDGTVLLTGGGFGVEPTASFLNVSVAKAGLRAAAKALHEPMKAKGIHLATVTVSTAVYPGSDKAREIGDTFWQLHAQPKTEWTWEATVK